MYAYMGKQRIDSFPLFLFNIILSLYYTLIYLITGSNKVLSVPVFF